MRVAVFSFCCWFLAAGDVGAEPRSFKLPNGYSVSQDELVFYLKERLVPEAYESAVAKPDALKNAIINLYVMKRAANLAVTEGLVTEGELAYRQDDGGRRLALQAFVADRSAQVLSSTDWSALADERYLAEQAKEGDRVQVSVEHILIGFEGRNFTELAATVAEVEAQLASGAEFSALALQYSDDSSVIRNAGNIGYVSRRSLDPAFAEAAFSMKEIGAVSVPILAASGVHFIKYNGRRVASAVPQSAIQSRLIKQLKNERSTALRGEVLADFRSEAWSTVAEIDEQALGAEVLRKLERLSP